MNPRLGFNYGAIYFSCVEMRMQILLYTLEHKSNIFGLKIYWDIETDISLVNVSTMRPYI